MCLERNLVNASRRCSFEARCRGGIASKAPGRGKAGDRQVEFPLAESSGFLVRDANRAFQRLLERRIAPYGVTRGQWYFLRVLWTEDGLSQRELSARVGTMEPTTVIALRSMEKSGLIRRVRSSDDKRRVAGVAHARRRNACATSCWRSRAASPMRPRRASPATTSRCSGASSRR